MLSVEEFSKTIKEKYPQYQSMDDFELTKKIIEKFPQYKGQVKLPQENPMQQSSTSQQSVAEREGWLGKAASAVGNAALGVGKSVVSTIEGGSTLIQKGGTALGGGLAGVYKGEGFKAGAQEALQKIEDQGSVAEQIIPEEARTPTNTAQKVGFAAGEIGQMLLPSGAVLRAGKALKGAKALQSVQGGSKLANAGKATARLLAMPAAEGAAAATVGAIQDGGLENVATNAALGAALPVVGGVGKAIKGFVGKAIPESLVKSAIKLTPTQKQAIANITGKGGSAEDYLLKNKITGSPMEISEMLLARAKDARKTKLETLSGIQGAFKSSKAEGIAQTLISALKQPGLEKEFSKVKKILDALKGGGTSLKELDELKSLADQFNSPFKLSGSVKEAAQSKGFANLRTGLRKFIEDQAEKQGATSIRSLNNEIRLNRKISDAIASRDIGAGGNALAGLSDYIVGGSVLGGLGGAAGGDLSSALKGILLGTGAVLLKKGFTPKLRIKLADALSKTFDNGEAGRILKFMNGDKTIMLTPEEKKKIAKALVEIDVVKLLPEGKKALPKVQINKAIELKGKASDEFKRTVEKPAKLIGTSRKPESNIKLLPQGIYNLPPAKLQNIKLK